ncbi:hypothetical protein [Elizabethkingia phage TCUEAP1]|nr:hypothetical protein [Elizabethkingia phage TCUEAP1]
MKLKTDQLVLWKGTNIKSEFLLQVTQPDTLGGKHFGATIVEIYELDPDYNRSIGENSIAWPKDCIVTESEETIIKTETKMQNIIKKIIYTIILVTIVLGALIIIGKVNEAKAQTKGSIFIETGTSTTDLRINPNGVMFYRVGSNYAGFAAGATVGYFVTDKLAIKAGAGYSKFEETVILPPSTGLESINIDHKATAVNVGIEYYIYKGLSTELNYSASFMNYNREAHFATVKIGYTVNVLDRVGIKPYVFGQQSLSSRYNSEFGAGVAISIKLN